MQGNPGKFHLIVSTEDPPEMQVEESSIKNTNYEKLFGIKFSKNFVFQAYGLETVKLVASKRRISNIVPEMVLFPKIFIKI